MNQATVCLADLCDVVTDRVEPEEQPDAVYVGLKHLETGRFARKGEGKAAETKSSKSAFRAGDILYGKLGAYLDKAVLAEDEGICSTDILVVRSRQDVDPRFLLGVIHSPQFIEHAVAGTTGVSHPRTSWSHISEFQFPSYAQEEQKNIGDFLWLMHKALTASEAVVNTGQTLKKVAMLKLFNFGLSKESQKETAIGLIPASWKVSPIKDIVRKTSTVNFEKKKENQIEYIDVSSVSRDSLKITNTSEFILREAPSRARKIIQTGDVIFATVRPTLLRVAHIEENLNQQICSTAFCVLRAKKEIVLDRYIFYLLQGRDFIDQLAAIQTGASYPAVTDTIIKEQLVPLPNLQEQDKIVKVLDSINLALDYHRKKCVSISRLVEAFLNKIFVH